MLSPIVPTGIELKVLNKQMKLMFWTSGRSANFMSMKAQRLSHNHKAF